MVCVLSWMICVRTKRGELVSIESAVKILVPQGEQEHLLTKSVGALGKYAGSVKDMGETRARKMAQIANKLIDVILLSVKAGAADASGVLEAITKLRDAQNSALGMALLGSHRQETDTASLVAQAYICLLYTSPSPRDLSTSRMPSSA